ncbi:MAG: SMP-30/gluconolactonase/LRE family protein [Gemmataceae bacterium]|nr:SMP-30/gluconolactonase/LRE family protein [Gemmataceae bacterium]
MGYSRGLVLFFGVIFAAKGFTQESFFPKDARVERVWTGGEFTEGPAYGPDHCVYFSDIGNRILKFDPATGNTTDFRNPGGRSNGLDFDQKGNLIAAEGANTGGNRRITKSSLQPGAQLTVLADSFNKKKFNSPNDLILDKNGGIYFTDPRYVGNEPKELDFEGVFYIAPGGKVIVATKECAKPNGLVLSMDGKTLYLAENHPSGARHLLSFQVGKDGGLSGKKVLYDFGNQRGVDGMCIDQKGNLFATAGSKEKAGIYVFSPEGKRLEFLPTPEDPSNCIFGGKNRDILYITAGKSLYRAITNTKGFHCFWPE